MSAIPYFRRILLALLAAPIATTAARAAVEPARVAIAYGERTRLMLRWSFPAGTFQPGEPITSPRAVVRLLAAGNCTGVLTTLPRPLRAVAGGQGEMAPRRERAAVGAALGVAARRRGAEGLCYERIFTGQLSQTAVSEVVRLSLTGTLGGTFLPTFVRLRFDDGSISRVVDRGTPLGVRAEIHHGGQGRLRAVWEVATPVSTAAGRPHFRRLRILVRRVTTPGRLTVEGPRLPTAIPGLHLVRLRFLEPEFDAPELVLRYYVRLPAALGVPRPLALVAPAEATELSAGVVFAWRAVPDATAYRLELRPEGGEGRAPTTGLLLPATETRTTLGPVVHARLAPGRWRWRVVAFDGAGRPVAASAPRTLLVSAQPAAPARCDGGGCSPQRRGGGEPRHGGRSNDPTTLSVSARRPRETEASIGRPDERLGAGLSPRCRGERLARIREGNRRNVGSGRAGHPRSPVRVVRHSVKVRSRGAPKRYGTGDTRCRQGGRAPAT